MGAAESTRKLTVVNEDMTGVIKVSDQVVKRIKDDLEAKERGQQRASSEPAPDNQRNQPLFAAPMETLTLRKQHEDQINTLEASWSKRIQALEKQNNQLWKSTTTRLSKDLTTIEEKYTKKRTYEPICPEIEGKVLDCYTANPSKPLNCSQQVKEFVGCVNVAKRAALLKG
jgi:hypothetical protein